MHIISRKAIREFCEDNEGAETSLDHWYRISKRAAWKNFAELRESFSSVDKVGECFVFNIGGNNYRLIARINFEFQKLYIRFILTHKEYDKEKWKDDC